MPWLVVIAKPASDHLAVRDLEAAGFEVYAPKYEKRVWRKGRKRRLTFYLFSPYVLVKLNPETYAEISGLRSIRRMLLSDAEKPGVVSDRGITQLKQRYVETGGLVQLPNKRRPGEMVEIKSGQFVGRFGIWLGTSSRQRDLVLLAELGKVELAVGDLD